MFYPYSLNIKSRDLVLEIGPGAYPHWRSDCLVDRFENAPTTDISQFGGAPQQTLGKPLFHVNEPQLPFRDKAFDYVICAQVLEHVPHQELPVLISEINRVGSRSYIEVPRPVFDLVYDFDVHLNLMDIIGNKVICLPKERTNLHQVMRFTQHARELRKTHGFSVESLSSDAVAVGKEFSGDIQLTICSDEDEFFDMIMQNIAKTPNPSMARKIKEQLYRLSYKFSHHPSKDDFAKLLRDGKGNACLL